MNARRKIFHHRVHRGHSARGEERKKEKREKRSRKAYISKPKTESCSIGIANFVPLDISLLGRNRLHGTRDWRIVGNITTLEAAWRRTYRQRTRTANFPNSCEECAMAGATSSHHMGSPWRNWCRPRRMTA